MLNALQSVLSVIIMIGLGFVLAKRGWFEGKAAVLISRLVVSIALPAYMINNLLGGYDRQGLLSMLPGLGIPFVAMISGFILASLLAVLIRIPKGRRGTFASMFSLSNSIFIGLPVNMLLFGDESLPFVLLYYIANTTCFWTIGTLGIANDGAELSGGPKPSLLSLSGLKRLLSPPLVAFIVAVVLIMLEIRLPKWVMDTGKYLGNMTTPLSMLFVGIVVARIDWRKLRFGLDMFVLVAGRFVFTPLIIFLLVKNGDFPVLMKQVFVIQAAMPAMTQTPILAEAYKADSEYAGLGTSLTTLLSLISIPVYMAFVGKMF
ncbi:MAG: AEC family transporter [Spirochaetia bacterium]|jgi:predicted permease|uniref:Membrane transport protein n=1 Tax=bioreactor metagenome TaxID=1076179 RepID=A0A644TMC6_9ZZZZ|nr:AEC family transporter [Spirochaetia bacterium]MCE1207951.1 AEC family transporter [Spirochaetia bacterium]MDD3820645.1 AEC family transporter [Spirochaetales bacterium]NLX45080.1 AEC family transporter [Treponema sp.]